MIINLKPVDKTNWKACIKLSLLPEQEANLAPNAYTIAESKFETHHHVRGIYKDDEVIGMLSYCYEDDPIDTELYWLFRFMLDKNHQGKGYASKVLKLVVEEISSHGGKRLLTMCKPTNMNAAKVYQKFGFKQTGKPGACPRTENLLQKTWIWSYFPLILVKYTYIRLKLVKNLTQTRFPSLRFLFSTSS